MADPVNPNIKLRSSTSASMVEVPAQQPALWRRGRAARLRGDQLAEISSHQRETRWIWVYTPPEREGREAALSGAVPVPRLQRYRGRLTLAGHANYILDNLLAEKKAVPMIVVMPYGHATPYGARGQVNTPISTTST